MRALCRWGPWAPQRWGKLAERPCQRHKENPSLPHLTGAFGILHQTLWQAAGKDPHTCLHSRAHLSSLGSVSYPAHRMKWTWSCCFGCLQDCWLGRYKTLSSFVVCGPLQAHCSVAVLERTLIPNTKCSLQVDPGSHRTGAGGSCSLSLSYWLLWQASVQGLKMKML